MAHLPSAILHRNLSSISPSSAANVMIRHARRLAAAAEPIMIDLGDGRGERSLQEILDETDGEIAAAGELESHDFADAANNNGTR